MEKRGSQRRLAAILFTDIVGYTALMQRDERAAIAAVKKHQSALEHCVQEHNGEVYQYYGDGSLSMFNSALDAVRCAYSLQKQMLADPVVPLRTGVHIGEIQYEDGKIFGDGVNLASRIESIGQPGTVFFSRHVYEKVRNHSDLQTQSVGTFNFKNVDVPMEVFALTNPDIKAPDRKRITGKIDEVPARRKRTIAGAAILAIAAVIATALWLNPRSTGVGFESWEGEKSIAVLPFRNLSEDSGDAYFGLGIAEDLITQLAKVNGLKVISRESSMKYKEGEKPLRTIARELGVMSLLQGSVRKYGNKVRISVQLVDPAAESYVWAEDFDRDIEDILNVQKDVAVAVTGALEVSLTPVLRGHFRKKKNVNADAYISYQRGRESMNRSSGTLEEVQQTVHYFEEAIRYDSTFALAYVGLADAHLEYLFWHRGRADTIMPKVKDAAVKALLLDPELGECYALLGSIEMYGLNPPNARPLLEKAIELSPNYSVAYERLAWVAFFDQDDAEFERLMSKAFELDPLSTKYKGAMTYAYYTRGKYDKGIEKLQKHLDLFPDDNFLLWNLGYLYVGKGEYEKGIETLRKRSIASETNWILGVAYAHSGQQEKAWEIINYHKERSKNEYIPYYIMAYLYLAVEEYDLALDYLELSLEEGSDSFFLWGLNDDRFWDPLRSHPRFQAVMRRLGSKSGG